MMTVSYEEAVLIPVSSYLDLCTSDADAAANSNEGSSLKQQVIKEKTEAIRAITASLEGAVVSTAATAPGNVGGAADSGGSAAHQHWSQFLRGGEGDGGSCFEAAVRDELLDSLVACCAEYDNFTTNTANDTDRTDTGTELAAALLQLRIASFQCLSSILSLRNSPTFDKSIKRGQGDCSLVGSRLGNMAPSILSTFTTNTTGDAGGNGRFDGTDCSITAAATDLLRHLLPPSCPREECPPVQIRDIVLVPLTSSSSTIMTEESIATAATLLEGCVVQSAEMASATVREAGRDGEDMRSLKVETAVLGQMQQMRPILANLIEHSAQDAVLHMFDTMHKLAPSAVESQLDDGGAGSAILARITPTDSAVAAVDSATAAASTRIVKESAAAGASSNNDNGDEQTFLPAFYTNLSEPPIGIQSAKQLDATLRSLQDDLVKGEDSEMWNLRFDALKTLERILAGGIIRSKGLRPAFLAVVRKMPIEKQILDLRSQITRAACRFLTALAYELRETGEQECFITMANFAEIWTPAVLKLSISGVRLMATQGMNCLLHLAALGGTYGYPRVVPTLCNGCVGKKVHQNHRRGCILALTAALRVWGGTCLERNADAIVKAVSESVCHRDPSVREEGRKALWALHAREEFCHMAEDLLAGMDSREKKRLNGAKADADAEWSEGGRMDILVRTGVDNGASPKTVAGASNGRKAVTKKSKASSRPSVRERLQASAMAKSRPSTADSEVVVVKKKAPTPRNTGGSSSAKSAPARSTVMSVPSLASTTNPTPSKRYTGKTPRKPAVPKQRRASALPATTPVRGPASVSKSARKKRMSAMTPGRAPASVAKSARKKRMSAITPGKPVHATTPYKFTPSMQRGARSIDDLIQMTVGAQWSEREKAFLTLTTSLEKDISSKSGKNSRDKPIDLSSFISSRTKVERFVGSLLDNMKEKNIRVCRSATQCCSACLRHVEMRSAIGPYLSPVMSTLFRILAKYEKGGRATENVYDAATSCLESIAESTESQDVILLFSDVLAKHNAAAGIVDGAQESSLYSSHRRLSDGGIQHLVDKLCGAVSDIDGNALSSPADLSTLFTSLAKLVSRPSNRYPGTPQHMTRASDDRLKNSVCELSRLLLDGNDVASTVSVFLRMGQDSIDPLIDCIWTFGGKWGQILHDEVVEAIKRGDTAASTTDCSNAVIMEGTFGASFAGKPSSEQADLFSDLLSPKPRKRTPEHDPLKSLAAVATPKTPALPCDIATRLLGVDTTPATTSTTSTDSGCTDLKSPLVPKALNVDVETPDAKADDTGTPEAKADMEDAKADAAETPKAKADMEDAPSQAEQTPYEKALQSLRKIKTPTNRSNVSPASSNDAKTPATKGGSTNTGTAMYTPYEKALRSLKKGKTPKLEASPLRTPGTSLYMERPSSMSPVTDKNFCGEEEDGDALPRILDGLKNSSLPQEQYVVLQSLLRYAKNNGDDNWEGHFSGILDCLLAGCGPDAEQSCFDPEPLSPVPINTQGSTTGSNTTSSKPIASSEMVELSPAVTAAASKNLYLQGLRALIKYVPQYFKERHIELVVDKLLQCSKSTGSYELVHAAERALESMADTVDAQQSFVTVSKHFITTATTCSPSASDENAAMALLTLRVLTKLVGKIPEDEITKTLPSLKPAIYSSLANRQVDMRKAAVFLIVEMHARLGDDVLGELEGVSAAQQKLVSIYIDRRKKEKAAAAPPVTAR